MTGNRVRRRALAVVLSAALAALLGACATLPQSGPVQQGNPDVREPGSIALVARTPGEGDSPEEIVDGFLRASGAGFTDDFTIARTFLTPEAAAVWNPLATVRVHAGQATAQETGTSPESVTVSAPLTGTVDHDGRYAEADSGEEVEAEFAVRQDDAGEWRIADLEDGVLLSEPLFRSIFQQTPLYFLTPDAEALVPETRWYPRRTVETSAASGVLAGPSDWLAPGVTSAFPEGTRLVVDAVAVRDGVAHVDLSPEALATSPEERTLMLAQMSQTLTGLPRVLAVQMTVEGVAFDVPEREPDLVVDPSVGTSPVMLAEGALQALEGGALVPIEGGGVVLAADPAHPALPYDDDVPVVLSGGLTLATVPPDGGAPAVLLTAVAPLTPPSFDRSGWVWTSPSPSAGVVHAVRTDATRVDIAADWLAGREVRALRVSRDGARVVVVSAVDGDVRVDVAAVVAAEGTPTALGEPLRIGRRIAGAGAAVWVDQQTVAVLGRTGTAAVDTVLLTPVGGPTSALPAVDGAVSLASGKGDRLLYVATAAGELFARNGLGWTSTVRGVRDPTFPG